MGKLQLGSAVGHILGSFLDFRGAQAKTNDFMWSQFSYVNDMFDATENPGWTLSHYGGR